MDLKPFKLDIDELLHEFAELINYFGSIQKGLACKEILIYI
ncbi:hypothetical protein CASFOL_042147 [Castilleja foliolosa]|uniref:Maturase K n=1 Tax=Castilleja foliolosa TaxID=1961234 RepID=A0ABD3BA65_9LAMI